MAIMNVRTFVHKNGTFQEGQDSVDTTDTDAMKRLREDCKKTGYAAVPVLEDGTVDTEMMEVLLKPGRRTAANWTDEMVVTAHELRANTDMTFTKIMLELYKRFDAEVSEDSIKKVLKQETHEDVEVEDELREAVKAKNQEGGGRRKISDEVREAVMTDMENGMSGVKAAEKHGVSFVTANGWYRKKYGSRR